MAGKNTTVVLVPAPHLHDYVAEVTTPDRNGRVGGVRLHNAALVYSCAFCVTQARYRKEQASAQPLSWIPPVDNLLKDSTDGSALAALLHFYCPQLLQLGGKELTPGLGCSRRCLWRFLQVAEKHKSTASAVRLSSIQVFRCLVWTKMKGIFTSGVL